MEKESHMKQSRFKRICVFCGSSQGKKRSYQDAAVELGRELVISKVSRNIDLEGEEGSWDWCRMLFVMAAGMLLGEDDCGYSLLYLTRNKGF